MASRPALPRVTDQAPVVLAQVETAAGRAELIEWHWPALVDFERREADLMIEMALPPMAAEASACLPELDPERRCHMGSLFVRWPGVLIAGRSEGGHIRVVRWVFAADHAVARLAQQADPAPAFLKAMLAIRSEPLRMALTLLRRELANPVDRSDQVVAALGEVIGTELGRVIDRADAPSSHGRLAGWQFHRIRQRLAEPGAVPTVADLARLCGISARHLHRQFFALTGTTVADYIEAARIEQAKRLLAREPQPIKAIARACGFSHANSFARAFRRSTGLSPLAFRQRSNPLIAGAQP